jgi:enamine deaminase RidA (YjgF/YER057c/UK114 family)
MAKIERYAAKGVFDPPAYAQAAKVTEGKTLLFISGQVAYTAEGGAAHPGDFKAQAHAALRALKAQVEAGGGTMADIVKITTFVTDMRFRPDWAAVRQEYFGAQTPPSTMVGVTALAVPEWLIEIEAIAVV